MKKNVLLSLALIALVFTACDFARHTGYIVRVINNTPHELQVNVTTEKNTQSFVLSTSFTDSTIGNKVIYRESVLDDIVPTYTPEEFSSRILSLTIDVINPDGTTTPITSDLTDYNLWQIFPYEDDGFLFHFHQLLVEESMIK